MHVLNFSHPLTEEQQQALFEQVGQPIASVRQIRTQLDVSASFQPQIVALLDELAIDSSAWQSQPWLIVLPSLNYAAAVLLAELHGRMGHFPTIVRLRPKPDSLVTVFELAEIINLESVRQMARTRR
ncbi:MAG: CRISPR-associated protein Csx15 [Anaerolineae bacterium]|nr:CRISPR-associated protein Csx15 [Anaerolineae bacterium]